jgi:hypothetical protein
MASHNDHRSCGSLDVSLHQQRECASLISSARSVITARRGQPRSGRTRDWIKIKNPAAPAARRLEEEDWN